MSLTVISALVLAMFTTTADAWMEFPYGSKDFNERQEYGKNVTIACDDGRLPDSYSVEYWIRPDLAIMESDDADSFWTLDGYATWRVSQDGKELHATLLNEKQFGFYYCVVSANSQRQVVKRAINYDGPYFGNLWPKYRMNVIVGASAAAIFLVLCVLLSLLANWCERRDKRHAGDNINKNGPVTGGDSSDITMDKTRASMSGSMPMGDGRMEEVRL